MRGFMPISQIDMERVEDGSEFINQKLRVLVTAHDAVFTYGGGDPVVTQYLKLGARACHPVYNALDPDTHHPAEPEPAFRPQDEDGATYARKLEPEDRILDLSRPARELVDTVRALSPHIGARAELEGRNVIVWRARVAEDGTFEPVEVQPEGGRRMEYDAWLRGLR
jgi:hypothetical protein